MTRFAPAVIVWTSLTLGTAAIALGHPHEFSRRQPATAPSTGATIWSGVYSSAQASRGEAIATKGCAKCHNADLTGGQDGPSLVGTEVLTAWSGLTLGDLFDRIRTTMPADAPQSLSAQETADILAYVLLLNKCPAGEKDLAADGDALRQIRVTPRADRR